MNNSNVPAPDWHQICAGKNVLCTVRTFIITDAEPKKLLLLRRCSSNNLKGQEEPPGGGVNRWEDLQTAAQREIVEECGSSISINWLHYIDYFEYVNKDGINKIEFFFYTIVPEQNITVLPAEHESFRWQPINLLSNSSMHPAIYDFFIKHMAWVIKS
jgi:8-oxo-dGTP pyrophosphatase MutT (NUDIX family)